MARARPARFFMPPGEIRRHLVEIVGEPDVGQFGLGDLTNLRVRPVGVAPQRKRHVLANGDGIEERGILKQEPHTAPNLRQLAAL